MLAYVDYRGYIWRVKTEKNMKDRKHSPSLVKIRYPEETNHVLQVLQLCAGRLSVDQLKFMLGLDDMTAKIAIHQLKACEMIADAEDGGLEVTSKGAETVMVHGSFTEFIESKKTEEKVKKSTLWTNYLTMANFICTFIGFIIGVLLSDLVKQLLWKILSAF